MTKPRRGRPRSKDWVGSSEMCRVLDCSPDLLKTLRDNGTWKQRKHWKVKNPKAARLTYLYHLHNCMKDLYVEGG